MQFNNTYYYVINLGMDSDRESESEKWSSSDSDGECFTCIEGSTIDLTGGDMVDQQGNVPQKPCVCVCVCVCVFAVWSDSKLRIYMYSEDANYKCQVHFQSLQ